jgi:hypothetical protein
MSTLISKDALAKNLTASAFQKAGFTHFQDNDEIFSAVHGLSEAAVQLEHYSEDLPGERVSALGAAMEKAGIPVDVASEYQRKIVSSIAFDYTEACFSVSYT